MGGDQAPDMVVAGADIARQKFPAARFLFVGDEARLRPLLDRHPDLRLVSSLRHTTEVVTNDAKPSAALRSGRQSSMRLAINAVQAAEAHAVISAGNTGALMAMAKLVLKTAPGIDRPAIAGFFPTTRGSSVMLDLGANVECDARNLVQFAIMGEVFARTVLGLAKPTIGLLNVGSEDQKGHEELRTASAVLRDNKLNLSFHGFVEGSDIAAGTVDVIVTDGFTGNIAIKTAEGTSRLFSGFLRQAFSSSARAKLGYALAKPALDGFRQRIDPRRYNGAILLGLNGIAVKSHGGTDAIGFANALGVAVEMLANGITARIQEELQHLGGDPETAPKPRSAAV
jgi:glycerol-3-phosphate acyltransferase PlsX